MSIREISGRRLDCPLIEVPTQSNTPNALDVSINALGALTNADRIRAMTDEDIATMIILGCQGRDCPSYKCKTDEEAQEHCWHCWVKWLKEESE